MSETLKLRRIAKVGIAKVGSSTLGLIPASRDRRARAAGATPKLYYGQPVLEQDDAGLAHTVVEQ